MTGLWASESCAEWREALRAYPSVVAAQPSELLHRRDPWYREDLPWLISARAEPYVMREELVWVVEWKMARGEWRARNLHLARSNTPDEVEAASRAAFAAAPDERAPLRKLSELKGVGPATASAVLAAYRPDLYPFFEDVVAAQVPGLSGDFTVKAYLVYAATLRERAEKLSSACGEQWTAQAVGLALWAASGGKSTGA